MPSYEPHLSKAQAANAVSADEREALVVELRRRIAFCLNLAETTSSATAEVLREIAKEAERELARLTGG